MSLNTCYDLLIKTVNRVKVFALSVLISSLSQSKMVAYDNWRAYFHLSCYSEQREGEKKKKKNSILLNKQKNKTIVTKILSFCLIGPTQFRGLNLDHLLAYIMLCIHWLGLRIIPLNVEVMGLIKENQGFGNTKKGRNGWMVCKL